MLATWISALAVAAATSSAMQLTEEEYYRMPQLFHLDGYEACLSQPAAVYCLGTFKLQSEGKSQLFDLLKHFSEHRDNFNHTRLHRGLCVSTRCGHIKTFSSKRWFRECVNDWTTKTYGLEARLTSLDYCRTKHGAARKPYDMQDIAFIGVIAVVILFNCAGTVYELMFQSGKEANKLLMSWSVVDNWRRLVADYKDGDPRLYALKPLQGIKALTLICVMLAHTAFAYYKTYIHNPQFFEKVNLFPLTALLYNGSMIVQNFVLLAGFLLTYNLLLYVDKEKRPLSLAALKPIIFVRLFRLAPVNMVVVWWAATWWARLGDGPMWAPLVESERARCRNNWWAQLLFVNNFVRPHERCLIQTWFLAVDMQLYLVVATLAVLLVRWPRAAPTILGTLFLLSMVANFLVAYKWNLKALLFLIGPKVLREQYAGNDSFTWLYAAPWGSLPTSLLSILLAFAYHHMQKVGFEPKKHKWLEMACRWSVLLIFLWILSGWYVQDITSPVLVALYSTLERPVFAAIISLATIGFLYRVDEIWWQLLTWRGWEILGRMSLTVLMVHWCFILSYLAVRPHTAYTSVLEIWGTWAMVMFVTFLVSLPVHLLLEAPAYRFFRHLLW